MNQVAQSEPEDGFDNDANWWKPGLFHQLQLSAQRSWHALVHLLHLTQQANPKVEMLRHIYLFDSCSERELRSLATQADAVQALAGCGAFAVAAGYAARRVTPQGWLVTVVIGFVAILIFIAAGVDAAWAISTYGIPL